MKRKRAEEELGITVFCEERSIHKTFRRLARTMHPDKTGTSETSDFTNLAEHRDEIARNQQLVKQRLKIIEIPLEVIPGKKLEVYVDVPGRCMQCFGRGFEIPEDARPCGKCGGKGSHNTGEDGEMQCVLCMGSGSALLEKDICNGCNGKGRSSFRTRVVEEIPHSIISSEVFKTMKMGGSYGLSEVRFVANVITAGNTKSKTK